MKALAPLVILAIKMLVMEHVKVNIHLVIMDSKTMVEVLMIVFQILPHALLDIKMMVEELIVLLEIVHAILDIKMMEDLRWIV